MFPAEKSMLAVLAAREERGALRKLTIPGKSVDFASNDYLGFARSIALYAKTEVKAKSYIMSNGSGGSRLLTGNTKLAEGLEQYLAKKHNTEAALLFNSGYDANVGLFSSLPSKDDTIIYDELVHASIHDGIRLSRATSFPFLHNDLAHLEQRLKNAKGNVFVAVESIYSMDGDAAPLNGLVKLCSNYNAQIILDEAHATGVFGMGLAQMLKLDKSIFARVHTFGKAMGCHGAVVTGSNVLKSYLVNYARSFIYTTALPVHSLLTIESAYELLDKSANEIEKLQDNIKYFAQKTNGIKAWIKSSSAVQSLVVPGNENVKRLAAAIQAKDMDVRPILSPTVPKGKERVRVCLHAYNSKAEIDKLLEIINREMK